MTIATETTSSVQRDDSRGPVSPAIGVLMLGGDFQLIGIARQLRAAQIPVVLVETELGIARFSTSVRRIGSHHGLYDDPHGAEYLLNLASRHGLQGWAIYCADDEAVAFLAKHHQELSGVFLMSVPPWEISRNFYFKDLAYDLAEAVGIPIPRRYASASLTELMSQDIHYPVVLKPTFKKNYYEKTKDKAVLASDAPMLTRRYNEMRELVPAEQIVVQQFIPGGPKNLYSFAAVFDGQRVVSGLSAHRVRQHPMDFGHATTFARVCEIPELEQLATRLLVAMKYRGVAEVEFMYDEASREYKFIEMNGRFWGWHTLTHAAGLNFPAQMLAMLQGHEQERIAANPNASWTRILTDSATVVRESLRFRMSPLELRETLFGNRCCAVWSWRDPIPFVAEILMSPYLWWRRGF